MAFDKTKFKRGLAARFTAIRETDTATEKVAEAIADAMETALADIEVVSVLKVSATVEAVPGAVEIDETLKGKLK